MSCHSIDLSDSVEPLPPLVTSAAPLPKRRQSCCVVTIGGVATFAACGTLWLVVCGLIVLLKHVIQSTTGDATRLAPTSSP